MAPVTFLPTDVSVAHPVFQPWTCCAQPAGSITHPDQLVKAGDWLPATVPGTAALALHNAGRWQLGEPYDFDAEDWWFHTTFAAPHGPCRLRCDGLATLAEIWLNGRRLLTTANMFRHYGLDLTPHLRPENELAIGFRSLKEDLKIKRPRPRWKTKLVSDQQLRWRRTSLLGRIPGWSPPVAAVGPWRAVHLETTPLEILAWRLRTSMKGDNGCLHLQARIRSTIPILKSRLSLGEDNHVVQVTRDGIDWQLDAELTIKNPALWWPHTYGEQALAPCAVQLSTVQADYALDCGKIGFRRVESRRDDNFGISVNGVPIFCRGACWTVSDPVGLRSDEALARDLRLARAAGVNMLRVLGTMVYESDRFYELCDEHGILVWQDFMFANMDYPVDDAMFLTDIETEAREQLARLAIHPCVAVLCGNSEVEQQAAMLGMPRELWRNAWFGEQLEKLCHDVCPAGTYVPSTPSGGALPFHVGEGIAHYYGVGAYQRSLRELRQADVKFTSECLGFAHIPEPDTVDLVMGGALPVGHHPRWKERVPRDAGAGWDFEDIRDFYLQSLFDVDPVKLRSFDMPRYLQLSRLVPGILMNQVFAEWRSGHSRNNGALIWFFKDFWPGAGFGIIDSTGVPKAAYYYLKRSWQPRQIALTDEGLDGLHLHANNESAEIFQGHIELLLLQDGHITVARGEAPCELPPRGRRMFSAEALLGGFHDVTYAYRFGPRKHDLAVATLVDGQRRVVSEDCYFVSPRTPLYQSDVKVDATSVTLDAGCYEVELQTDRFLEAVRFDAKGYLPDDNYFNLLPGRPKKVRFTALNEPSARFRAALESVNLRNPVLVRAV